VQVNVACLRLFLRSSTGPNRAFEPQSLGRVRDPVRIAEGPTAIDAATQRRHFGFRLRLVDKLQPIGAGRRRHSIGASEAVEDKRIHQLCSARSEVRGVRSNSACGVAEYGADRPAGCALRSFLQRAAGSRGRDCARLGRAHQVCSAQSSKANSSRVSSQSRRILPISPGPIVSPAWMGTTVVRPPGCHMKWWRERVWMTEKPALSKAAATSFPVSARSLLMMQW